ncbi:MAG: (2Fe-2S)-binding protein [Litorimonas sp.]
MIHCICNNINTKDIDRAAMGGAETAECVQRACESEFNCGQCRESITARLKLWYQTNDVAVAAE